MATIISHTLDPGELINILSVYVIIILSIHVIIFLAFLKLSEYNLDDCVSLLNIKGSINCYFLILLEQ